MNIVLSFLRMFMLTFIRVYELLLIARAISSWFPSVQGNPIISFLYAVTEPVMAPVRACLQKIPALRSFPIDFSIIIVFIVLDVLRMVIYAL